MSTGDNAASPARAKAAFARISSADKKALWVTRSNHMIFWDYDREEAKAAFVEFLARRHPPANSR
jgi:esterase/lipase